MYYIVLIVVVVGTVYYTIHTTDRTIAAVLFIVLVLINQWRYCTGILHSNTVLLLSTMHIIA
eukprot:COSAG02_NODE_971_length_15551_cov_4.415157_22_plen_62_part_00